MKLPTISGAKLACLAAGTVYLSACGGSSTGPAAQTPAAAPEKERVVIEEILGHLGQTHTAVVGISLQRARANGAFQRFGNKLLGQFQEIEDLCNIKVLDDVQTIVVGTGTRLTDDDDYIFAFQGNFNRAKVADCVIKKGGSVANTAYDFGDGEVIHMHWPSEDIILISEKIPGKDIAAAATTGPLRKSPQLLPLLAHVDFKSTLWGAGLIPDDLAQSATNFGAKPPTALYFNANADSGMDVNAGISFANADDAAASSELLTQALSAAKANSEIGDFFNNVTTMLNGTTLVVEGELSTAQLDRLATLIGLSSNSATETLSEESVPSEQ